MGCFNRTTGVEMNKLNIQSIFHSIDGEVNAWLGAGELSTFIRLKGCNFYQYGGCSYCDTKYSQNSKPENWIDIDEVVERVLPCKKLTITGGEPLLQQDAVQNLLLKLGKNCPRVTIETNGSIGLSGGLTDSYLFPLVRVVMDYKLPSSGMELSMQPEFFDLLREYDVIKFVIADKKDYQRACEIIKEHPEWKARKVFSPMVEIIPEGYCECNSTRDRVSWPATVGTDWPQQLVEMMIEDKVEAQFSLQIHKLLWPGAKEER